MKPVTTDRSNLTLVHPEAGDLPAEIIVLTMADGDETTCMAIETVWQPDEGEAKALANGAPIHLQIYGGPLDPEIPSKDQVPEHPPVSVQVGAPAAERLARLLDAGHVQRALGYLFGALNENGSIVNDTRRGSGIPENLGERWRAGEIEDLADEAAESFISGERIRAPFDYVVQHHQHGIQDAAPLMLQIDGFLNLWDEAIAATRDVPSDGPSIADIALPTQVREDV